MKPDNQVFFFVCLVLDFRWVGKALPHDALQIGMTSHKLVESGGGCNVCLLVWCSVLDITARLIELVYLDTVRASYPS